MYDKVESAMAKAFPMLPMSVIRHVSKILYREIVKAGFKMQGNNIIKVEQIDE